jgi:hypothetical protein
MIRINGVYHFHRRDCAGAASHTASLNGTMVRVVDAFDCLDCWWVRCIETGDEFQAFGDELEPVIQLPHDACDGNDPLYALGEQVIAMRSYGAVRQGEAYRITAFNRDGSISLSRLNELSDEFTLVPGEHDPRCFRR